MWHARSRLWKSRAVSSITGWTLIGASFCGCSDSKSVVGPTGALFPTHHVEPAWSTRNIIAYRDEGIVCVDRGGGYTVDSALVGIWLLDPASGAKQRLIPNGSNPAWSPMGDKLSFELDGRVMVTSTDSINYQHLSSSGQSHSSTWDPDGRRIAFDSNMQSPSGSFTIFVMNAAGGGAKSLGQPGSWEWRMPSWSPDGNSLAHVRFPGGATISSEIFVMDTTGASATRLTINNVTDRYPAYSPDGSMLAFSRHGSNGIPQIWVMNSTGGGEPKLTSNGGAEPTWSPDGLEMAFVRENSHDSSPGGRVLWAITLATRVERQLTQRWPQQCP